jgi:hypothetical protein
VSHAVVAGIANNNHFLQSVAVPSYHRANTLKSNPPQIVYFTLQKLTFRICSVMRSMIDYVLNDRSDFGLRGGKSEVLAKWDCR